MIEMKFSSTDKEALVYKVTEYFENELGQNIGNFEAEFLIDFFIELIGPALFNKGLNSAYRLLTERMDEFYYTVQEQEKPSPYEL
ncbi:DUF2164 domain-containing protein [Aliidiomarina taiwanensis]|uniref:DUF2164 domain-containing protein n=1 Tax=Aliidiomarina taiwanensis TaxID=946228 RepID=A0A432XAA4_9GAMM|nr:DUF2164 domain-containing protein [Aliidiomarina taiwanensis]RUO44289.1 DUF2164 domain-containing protein [Aliidiomarina taiwanensis]